MRQLAADHTSPTRGVGTGSHTPDISVSYRLFSDGQDGSSSVALEALLDETPQPPTAMHS